MHGHDRERRGERGSEREGGEGARDRHDHMFRNDVRPSRSVAHVRQRRKSVPRSTVIPDADRSGSRDRTDGKGRSLIIDRRSLNSDQLSRHYGRMTGDGCEAATFLGKTVRRFAIGAVLTSVLISIGRLRGRAQRPPSRVRKQNEERRSGGGVRQRRASCPYGDVRHTDGVDTNHKCAFPDRRLEVVI